MKSDGFWQFFLTTGSPEAYLAYNEAKRMEQGNVFEYKGPGTTGHSLQ